MVWANAPGCRQLYTQVAFSNASREVATGPDVGHTPPMTTPRIRLELRPRLGSIAASWDELSDRQALPSPFLRSWWIDHVAGGTPAVLCCFDGADLVGGAAFELDRVGRGALSVERVRSLGQGVLAPDHLDLLAEPGREAEVEQAVVGWLRRPGSRLVDLDGLAATGRLARAFSAGELERVGAPYAALPTTGAEYLAARPGKVRSTITRTRKRFDREGVVLHRVGGDEVDAALDALAELHDQRWSEASEFLHAWDRCRAAAVEGAARGDVLLHVLRTTEGEVVAIELDLRAGDRLAFYQAGRRIEREWRGCGSVLRAGLIDRACEEGLVEYDLLRGDESYKADWADGRRELVRCRVGVGPLGRAVDAAARAHVRTEPQLRRARDAARGALSPGSWRRRRSTRDELSH